MADYTESKEYDRLGYPVEAKAVSSLLTRVEALITPELLKSRYLQGINVNDFNDEQLKDRIVLATNDIELKLGVPVFKVQFKERLSFDRDLYRAFVFVKTNNGPVLSVESFLIESSNGENIFKIPATWLEMGFAHKRQINIIPILTIFGAAGLQDGQASNAGLIFIRAVSNFHWMPAFYSITYTAGICKDESSVPVLVNDIIGMTAAIEILSQKQSQILYTSQSISQDGISQGSSGMGPNTYKPRIDMLIADRDAKLKKLKAEWHQKYFLSNI